MVIGKTNDTKLTKRMESTKKSSQHRSTGTSPRCPFTSFREQIIRVRARCLARLLVCFGAESSNPPVHVLKPDDVVFAKVLAALHFDHDQIHDAGILKPVLEARRNVG
jgi:hypothetical protein